MVRVGCILTAEIHLTTDFVFFTFSSALFSIHFFPISGYAGHLAPLLLLSDNEKSERNAKPKTSDASQCGDVSRFH